MSRSPALVGSWLALLSAVAFGVTTPLVQNLGRGAGPFATAACLYLGAYFVALFVPRERGSEEALRRKHMIRVLAVAVLGACIAPAALAWGLSRTSGVSASLMLNMEAVFTVVLARAVYKEHIGRRVLAAVALIVAGGALLTWKAAPGEARALGLVAVAVATLAWAADNTLTKPLSQIDPGTVVLYKSYAGFWMSVGLAVVLRDPLPTMACALGLVACGAAGYGLSLRFYLLAQRRLGAARTGSIFATGPFLGAVVASLLGEPLGGWPAGVAAAAMILGIALHLTEKHEHRHAHEALEHEHAHRHDDGHHDHAHDPMPEGGHSHVHQHERVVHSHPHLPDPHHEHEHEHD